MAVLVVTAIALGLGIPVFATLISNERMMIATNDLVSSLHAARSEALKRQLTVTLCATPSGTGNCQATNGAGLSPEPTLAAGWTVFVDNNEDALISPGEVVLQRHGALDQDLVNRLTSSPNPLMFSGQGILGLREPHTDFHIQLCDHRGMWTPVGEWPPGAGFKSPRWVAPSCCASEQTSSRH